MPDDDDPRFLADMGVSWRVVEWLRSEGYDASHLREEGLERLSDHAIFTKASSERRWSSPSTSISEKSHPFPAP